MDMILEQFKMIFDRPEKVKRLRETILDLALRGKLVPQDPNDEPASVLFQKIKKEKSLAEISEDEKPFELPIGWEFVRIGDLGNIFNGNSINAKIKETVYANVEEGYNYISTKDVAFDGKGIDYNTGVKVPYDEKKFKVAHSGSVLICSEGGSAGRKIGLTDKDICFGNKLYAIEPIKGVLSEYIFYLYQSPMFFEAFTSKMTGIIGGISIANFKEINIPLCTLNEQKRIVEKVDSMMTFCDKLEKALEEKVYYGELSAKSVFNAVGNVSSAEELEETLKFILLNFKDLSLGDNAVKELKNCILQLAVQGKLVPQDSNDESAEVLLDKVREDKERLIKEKKIKKEKNREPVEKKIYIPNNWEWIRLGQIIYDITYGTSKKCDYNLDGVAILRIPNVSSGNLQLDDIKYTTLNDDELNRLSLKKGDLLIIRSNGSSEIVGKSTLISDNLENYSFAGYLIRVRMNNNYINSEYINKVINSKLIRSQIEPSLRTTTGVKNVNSNEIGNLIIPLPPLGEQKRIVDKVNSLMALCDKLEKKIEKQKFYSNRLMESIVKNII